MKIAITGHTSGLGKTLAKELNKNHEIIGFSRKNIAIENYKKIVNKTLDCDIFINNAHSYFYQTLLLQEIFNKWKNKNKTIVNKCNFQDKGRAYIQKATVAKALDLILKNI